MVSLSEKGISPPEAHERQENNKCFLEAIGRPDLKEILTSQTPWVDFTMEMYLQKAGLVGGGGLGILKGDTALQVEKLDLPFAIFTLFYPSRIRQKLGNDFYPEDFKERNSPEDLNCEKLSEISVRANGDVINFSLYKIPNLSVYLLYEPGLQYLYPGRNDTEHRLYQQTVLGFGGYKALKELNFVAPMMQIDECVSVFAEVAALDDLCHQEGKDLITARELLKQKTLLTNHTLVSAATAIFSREQFERYITPNLQSEEVEKWLRRFIDDHGGDLNLSSLALELSGKYNGVSKVHAQTASHQFKKDDGIPAEFYQITNGIFLERWVSPHLLELHHQAGIIDKFDLPTLDYQEKIDGLPGRELRKIKEGTRANLRDYLKTQINQYGELIEEIPEDAKIACWTKRFAAYKRPRMIFERPERLAEILEKENTYLILAGKTHPSDEPMKQELQRILKIIDANPILRKRVHFIQDYGEELAKRIVAGVDINFNTPQVKDDFGNPINTEADGTFWKKAMINNSILISTRDGGVADISGPLPGLEITGNNYQEEVDSLYQNLEIAAKEIDNFPEWEARIKAQLKAYLPIICGTRMIKEYLNFAFPSQT